MQPTDTPVNSAPTSPLLKLPGELRNRIYEFAQEPSDIYLIHELSPQNDHAYPISRPFFFCLTQVCRQLRSEYQPMYMAQTKVHIQCVDSLLYINTFILAAGIEPTLARGDLTVEGLDTASDTRGKLSHERDIIHLIQLCRSAPQVNVAFDLADFSPLQHRTAAASTSTGRMQRMLRILTQPEAAPELHAFIQISAEHVECCLNVEQGPSVFFWTRRGHAETWMHAWSHACATSPAGQDSYERMKQWSEEMRLNDQIFGVDEYVNVEFIVDEEWKDRLSDEWGSERLARRFDEL